MPTLNKIIARKIIRLLKSYCLYCAHYFQVYLMNSLFYFNARIISELGGGDSVLQ